MGWSSSRDQRAASSPDSTVVSNRLSCEADMDMMAHSVQTASPDTSSEVRGPDCWVGRDQVQGVGRRAFTLSLFLLLDTFPSTGPEWVAQVRCAAPGAEPRTGRVAGEHGEHQPLAPHAQDWWIFCPSVLLSFCPSVLLSFCPSVLLSYATLHRRKEHK
ncbi:hypothetical protein NBRC3284_2728 [Acetobacter pasteurianus NBRC 3284]|nr:hypothetical protein NBRC3284_2728 [Acetobacter pasteurianus NBRC 3284]